MLTCAREQFILNLNLMFVVSKNTGHDAKLLVLKTIPLIKRSGKRASTTGTSRSSTAQPDVQQSSHEESAPPRPNIPTVNAGTSRHRPPVPSFKSAVPRLPATQPSVPAGNAADSKTLSTATSSSDVADKFKSWAESAIRNQQRDIDRVSGTVERIEREMQLFRDLMGDIRTELASDRDLRARELEGIEKMRQRIEDNEQGPRSSGNNCNCARSLEGLTEDILHVNEKANEVDEVRAEMQKLQGRLKELEELASARSIASAPEPRPQTILPSSPAKRSHEQINELSTPVNKFLSPPKNPNKKRRLSHRSPVDGKPAGEEPNQGSTGHFGTPEMIGLGPEGPDILTGDDNDHDVDNQFSIEHKEPNPEPEPELPPQRRSTRIEARIPGRPRISLPQRQLEEITTSDADKRRRKSDVNYSLHRTSARRNSDGLIVASNGKIDGRSLRYKKHLADIGYQTPQLKFLKQVTLDPDVFGAQLTPRK